MVDQIAQFVEALSAAAEPAAAEALASAALRDGLPAGLVAAASRLALDRLRAEAALKAAQLELEQFVYVASHDLQEPLRKVQAFGDQLAAECGEALTADGRLYLGRMQDASQRMRGLIDDLLTYSRVATRLPSFRPVDLNAVVADVLDDLALRVKQETARVDVEELPVVVGDPLQMRQLFQNLLGNALKFKKPGSGVAVRVRAEAASARFLSVVVEDDGLGFEPKYNERIFGVFQRLHGRFEYSGNGIGLAICRKIADRHGGAIAAFGAPGKGARFTVTLPRPGPATEVAP